MERIATSAKQETSALRRNKVLAILMASVLMPLVEGIWISYKSELDQVDSLLFWLPISVFIIIHALSFLWTIQGAQLLQESYFASREIFEENEELSTQSEKLKNVIRSLTILHEAVLGWRVMLRKYKSRSFDEPQEIHECISEILSVVVDRREEIFEISGVEWWSFAIYIFDKEEAVLKPIWREKHRNHPASTLGRTWHRGEGHIGSAFNKCDSIFTDDVTEGDLGEALGPRSTKVNPYDSEAYRAFGSIPIGPINDNDLPIGVLVATSNIIGRFDKANCLILRHAAAVLANLIHINEIERKKLLALSCEAP